jgi:NitT/TauT family transport system substrate-binding protein
MTATRRQFLGSLAALALAGPGSARADIPPIRINIPGPGALPFLPVDLIPKLGLDRELGTQLSIRYFPSGIQGMEDMLNGSADFAGFAFSVVPRMVAKGVDLVAIAPLSGKTPPYAVVVRKDLRGKVRTLADLRGRSVGVSVGSAMSKTYLQTVAEQILASAGVPADQVRWVGTSQNTEGQVGALAGGVVDAVFCEEPFVSILVKRKLGFILADLSDPKIAARIPGLGHLRATIATTRAALSRDPGRAEVMVTLLRRSLAWINQHDAGSVIARLDLANPAEREERLAALRHVPGIFSPDLSFSRQQLAATKEFLLATSDLAPEKIDLDKVIDSRWAGMRP